MTENQIARLTQVVIEDTYCRKNIREKVYDDIFSTNPELKAVYLRCYKAILAYIEDEYYESKQRRLEHISFITVKDILIEIFMAVIPNEGMTAIQKVAAPLVLWLDYEDVFDGIKTAAELLAVTGACGLHNMIKGGDSESGYMSIESLWKLSPETMMFIRRTHYLNPMVTPPDPWNTNADGGYITSKGSVLLGKGNHGDHVQALGALNIVQQIEWELDENMLQYDEESKKPLDTPQKTESFEQRVAMTKVIYKELIALGNKFWFKWGYDFRGRMYIFGHFINLQGNSFHKAALNFKLKKYIEE